METNYNVAEITLLYNRPRFKQNVQVSTSNDAYKIFKDCWDENKIDLLEEFKIILLDRANYVLGVSHISTGGISSCIVDPKIVFATALKGNCSSIVLAHNHPSGNPKCSESDMRITEKLMKGGDILDITVFDHLIITSDGYSSMAENGLMPR